MMDKISSIRNKIYFEKTSIQSFGDDQLDIISIWDHHNRTFFTGTISVPTIPTTAVSDEINVVTEGEALPSHCELDQDISNLNLTDFLMDLSKDGRNNGDIGPTLLKTPKSRNPAIFDLSLASGPPSLQRRNILKKGLKFTPSPLKVAVREFNADICIVR